MSTMDDSKLRAVRNTALEDACAVVYGQCESDNVAQRTVNAIRALKDWGTFILAMDRAENIGLDQRFIEMPPLPIRFCRAFHSDVYSADQMRDYGKKCAAILAKKEGGAA